jgi:hypothetical protein
MPALEVIHPERMRDDYVLIKVDASTQYATHSSKLIFTWLICSTYRKHTCGHDEGCGVGCDYTGTVVLAGSKVSWMFGEGDPVTCHTYGAASVGKEDSALDKPSIAEGAGYYNNWERVRWTL